MSKHQKRKKLHKSCLTHRKRIIKRIVEDEKREQRRKAVAQCSDVKDVTK